MCFVCQSAMSIAASAMSIVPGIGTTDGVIDSTSKPTSRQVAAAVESATLSSRAGRSCEKRGDTTVVGGESYTCRRTGKSLRWRRD